MNNERKKALERSEAFLAKQDVYGWKKMTDKGICCIIKVLFEGGRRYDRRTGRDPFF